MTIRDSIKCPRVLTSDEISEIDWNDYSIEEIDHLIACGSITEEDMVQYYNNEWWRVW